MRVNSASRRSSAPARKVVIAAATAAALSAGLVGRASAQTSGTWAADFGTFGGSWSDPANWAGGVVPGNGGTVTFTTLPSFTSAPVAILQDAPTVSVSGIKFDSFITYLLR